MYPGGVLRGAPVLPRRFGSLNLAAARSILVQPGSSSAALCGRARARTHTHTHTHTHTQIYTHKGPPALWSLPAHRVSTLRDQCGARSPAPAEDPPRGPRRPGSPRAPRASRQPLSLEKLGRPARRTRRLSSWPRASQPLSSRPRSRGPPAFVESSNTPTPSSPSF